MANLKEVRIRITSVNSTQQITKAMKMVAAAKLRRAQDAIVQMRPYASKLKEILENVAESVDASGSGVYAKVRPVNKVLIVAVTSNRGLAGAFNSNIIRTVNRLIGDTYKDQVKAGNLKVLAIGRKASDFYSKNKNLYVGNHNDVYANLNFNSVASIAEEIMQEFANGNYDKVIVIYNQFKNAAVQYVITEQLLPITPPVKRETSKSVNDYIFEPSQEQIVLDLIPKSIKTQLYKAILDSNASEHGARMTAMSKATDNAGELIKALKLQYNKARQAAITNEILEIVAGAEALKG
ncbi:MAG: ATP synthase F1 subunit gamma [Bacteroidia bacterium]|nr:ATP synthase F1 subunit gamma [Bacteroidota bacterium]MBK8873360.1 ATP synthase F1 subunit gamma [Bacteroidota bacterium]MBK9424342.1 ATP synthase F1 subunit gamma [Bacteroidota bacterium]MBP9082196.1 ATP synthase F1 subunit gamma [Bacteroidia bacterium]